MRDYYIEKHGKHDCGAYASVPRNIEVRKPPAQDWEAIRYAQFWNLCTHQKKKEDHIDKFEHEDLRDSGPFLFSLVSEPLKLT